MAFHDDVKAALGLADDASNEKILQAIKDISKVDPSALVKAETAKNEAQAALSKIQSDFMAYKTTAENDKRSLSDIIGKLKGAFEYKDDDNQGFVTHALATVKALKDSKPVEQPSGIILKELQERNSDLSKKNDELTGRLDLVEKENLIQFGQMSGLLPGNPNVSPLLGSSKDEIRSENTKHNMLASLRSPEQTIESIRSVLKLQSETRGGYSFTPQSQKAQENLFEKKIGATGNQFNRSSMNHQNSMPSPYSKGFSAESEDLDAQAMAVMRSRFGGNMPAMNTPEFGQAYMDAVQSVSPTGNLPVHW